MSTLSEIGSGFKHLSTVSKYLGHASTKETLDTYAHMFPNNLTNVKNTIDNLNLGI